MGLAIALTAAITVTFSPLAEHLVPAYAVHSATAARMTANALFRDVVLPSGSRNVTDEHMSSWLNIDPVSITDPAPQSASGFFLVPMGFKQTAAFISYHLPAGLHLESQPETLSSRAMGSITYWSGHAWVLGASEGPSASPFTRIFYALSSPSSSANTTVVHVGIQVYWSPLRPADEQVTPATHFVKVTRAAYKLAAHDQVVATTSVSSANRAVINHFSRLIRALPVQLHGETLECMGPAIGPNTILYRYVIAFAGTRSAPTTLGITVRFCSNITASVHGRPAPDLFPDDNTMGGLYAAIEAVFSPGNPLVFFSGEPVA